MMEIEDLKLRSHHQAFIKRFVEACHADDRIVAAFLGGSNAKGYADQYSDIDVCVITTDSSYQDFLSQRETFLRSLGDLQFLEDFGNPDSAFFIFADDTEGELNFGSESRLDRIHSGRFRVLLDKKNILADAVFPEREPDPSGQMEKLRHNINLFWHEMSHFTTAMGRGKLWWARGQLEALRSICVNLARLQNNFSDEGVGEEPYFKIEYEMNVTELSPLESTFCPMEKTAMLQSVRVIVQFYKEIAQALASKYDIPYPRALEGVMLERLEKLSD